MIQVSIPAEAGEKSFDYNAEMELINPIAEIIVAATFQGADVDWYIKTDDIIPKQNAKQINNKDKRDQSLIKKP